MSRLGGPEIKMPQIKSPAFLSDLFYDLKDRNLLPVVALLLVAIVAVPILLSGSSKGAEPDLSGEGFASFSASKGGGGVIVAKAAPGLRSYNRRLSDLQATDPFKQRFTAAGPGESSEAAAAGGEAAAEAGGGGSETEVEVTGTEVTGAETGGGGSSEASGEGASAVVRTETKFASYEIDARIVTVASSPGGESTAVVRRDLPELTMLPGRQTPAVVFMGVSADAKKAMMLVSSDVQSVFGDALCVIGSETCQLLAMAPGLPETFVYGGQGRTYRIEVLKIEKVVSKHPERAKLGTPKQSSQAPANGA
ncbi:MAG TPA: hypothetical protein VII45_09575 [Solirubrobacterales bacterium]